MVIERFRLNMNLRALQEKMEKAEEAAEALRARQEEMKKREAELQAELDGINGDTPDDVLEAANGATDEYVRDVDALKAEIDGNQSERDELQSQIDEIKKQLDEMDDRANTPAPVPAKQEERKMVKTMENREFFGMSLEQRDAMFAREDVKTYLGEIRSAISEKRAISNAGLLIPDVLLGLIRHEIAHRSKLLSFVNLRRVGGNGRQNIAGAIPEAVWTEMCANINELTLSFNQIEVDGYKVGGFIAVCNAVLQDSDIDLAAEIVNSISGAIAKALDKAILFGTGTKMPTGIVTRLAQTAQPADWGTYAPTWTDLHATNVIKIAARNLSGVAFFAALIEKLGVAKPWYNSDGLFWVMNRKTHLDIMTKALAFNSNAALVSNTTLMPIIGGTVIEMEDDEIADYDIIGGYGGNYLLAERHGMEIASSDLPRFLQDQTVFKGTARYDGKPVAGEAFVIVNYNDANPTTEKEFPADYANADMNDLIITAAAGSAAGKTVLTVSGTIAQSNPVLKYKVGLYDLDVGSDLPAGFETLTSGTTAITAAAGKKITVVELDGNGRVVSAGTVASVPKT